MKYTLPACILLFMFCFITTSAQDGVVQLLDKDTSVPLPFATIQYAPGKGVISNEEGYFKLPEEADITLLTISCLGYEGKQIPYPLASETVYLRAKAVQLSEVLLHDRYPTGNEIMELVRANLNTNHQPRNLRHKIFSRETSAMDFKELEYELDRASHVSKEVLSGTNAELQSLSKDIKANKTLHYTDYLGEIEQIVADSIGCLDIKKATKLVDNKRNYDTDEIEARMKSIIFQYLDTTKTYKLKTGLFTIEKSMDMDDLKEKQDTTQPKLSIKSEKETLNSSLSELGIGNESWISEFSDPQNYEFQLKGITTWNSRNVYQVSFKPDRGSAKYEGEFLVDMQDYGIHHFRYEFAEGKRGSKLNLKLLLGIKFVENQNNGIAHYKRNESGGYYPHYYSNTEGAYIYVSRPFSLQSNEGKKEKIKFGFTLGGQTLERSEILFSDTRSISTTKQCPKTDEIPLQQLKMYDPTIWEAEEVLQPLQEMKDFGLL